MLWGIKGKIKRFLHRVKHEKSVMKQLTDEPAIFYFGIPMHSNLGDLAQYVCICRLLKTYFPEYRVIKIDSKVFMNPKSNLRQRLKGKIKPNDLIFFQSGYCTQDLGGVEDLMHQAVMTDYPDNQLVMLPQTVYFKTAERKQQASKVYNAHKHLLFFARDNTSFEYAKEMFPDLTIYHYPDIVTTLIGKYNFEGSRSGILMCLRNDSEKFYSEQQISELQERLSDLDTVSRSDTTISRNVSAETPSLPQIIDEYIKQLSTYKLIITDRYHGTILSLVANTPVIVIKTNDHKVRTGVEWFKGIYNDVVYVDDIMNVPEQAKKMMERAGKVHNEPYFEEHYYKKLRDLIFSNMEAD